MFDMCRWSGARERAALASRGAAGRGDEGRTPEMGASGNFCRYWIGRRREDGQEVRSTGKKTRMGLNQGVGMQGEKFRMTGTCCIVSMCGAAGDATRPVFHASGLKA